MRRPLHYPGQQHSDKSKHEQDDLDQDDNASWTPQTPTSSSIFQGHPATPTPPKPPFQPSYVYDADEELRVLRAERYATRLRNCVCCGICLFAGIFVLVCLGMVLAGSPTPRAQAMDLLDRIQQSPMVQFTITPKPRTVLEKYGKRRDETKDFHGFTMVRGQLFPYRSFDQANRLSVDGWIHVQTNTSVRYDMVLSNHRGYQIMRSVPLTQHRRSRCVTFDDVPPLHYLPLAVQRAFQAQDWASFRMNCSRVVQAPVEIVFAHRPFVFCPDDLVTTPFAPIANASTTISSVQSQTLWVHGERMLIEIVLVNNTQEATHARSERTRLEALEMWGNATTLLMEDCPYLEAPLASYTPRSLQMLDTLLGKTVAPQRLAGSESSWYTLSLP